MNRYCCLVRYRTPTGFDSSFLVYVVAGSRERATDMAVARCRRERSVGSIEGGQTTLADADQVPA